MLYVASVKRSRREEDEGVYGGGKEKGKREKKQ